MVESQRKSQGKMEGHVERREDATSISFASTCSTLLFVTNNAYNPFNPTYFPSLLRHLYSFTQPCLFLNPGMRLCEPGSSSFIRLSSSSPLSLPSSPLQPDSGRCDPSDVDRAGHWHCRRNGQAHAREGAREDDRLRPGPEGPQR